MNKMILYILIAAAVMACAFPVSAANDEQTTTIPVTLTVAHGSKNINVTLPVVMPVSVLAGRVLTADNLSIQNHSKTMPVRITNVTVESAAYTVADYGNFPATEGNRIALRINGCETKGTGNLGITEAAFPAIPASDSLPIRYQAKVSASADVTGVNAANVIFTLKAG